MAPVIGHTLASPRYDKEDEIKLEALGYTQARRGAAWRTRIVSASRWHRRCRSWLNRVARRRRSSAAEWALSARSALPPASSSRC